MRKYLFPFFLLSAVGLIHAQNLELPLPSDLAAVVKHRHYTLEYNENFELAAWVAYELTAEEVRGLAPRQDAYRRDPLVNTGSAGENDYRGTGYDRGHLAPAGDMKINAKAMSESFYMSNIAPQHPSLNRGIWLTLEKTVRNWAIENGALLIAAGPILDLDTYKRAGASGVAIPKRYYKVILDYREPELKGIGFILENWKNEGSLGDYAVSIDEVERVTGIDFYHQIPDETEAILESSYNLKLWPFTEYRGEKRVSPPDTTPDEGMGSYWINTSSDTRHNPSCRFYGNTKRGHYTDEATGKACGICGG